MTLARGLVWCKSCQVRTALADAGGKCPVCDPDQGNVVSRNAADELDRIDAVLAGSDTRWEGAEWRADASHQDDMFPRPWVSHDAIMAELAEYDWRDAYSNRHVVPRVSGHLHVGGDDGWRNVGELVSTDTFLASDTAADDDVTILSAWPPSHRFTVVLMTTTTQFTETLLRALFGLDVWEIFRDREDLARWEDDGGPAGPSEDFFDV